MSLGQGRWSFNRDGALASRSSVMVQLVLNSVQLVRCDSVWLSGWLSGRLDWATYYKLLTDCSFFSFSDCSFLPPFWGLLFLYFCWASVERSLLFGLSYSCAGISSLLWDFLTPLGLCGVFWYNDSKLSEWWQFCSAWCNSEYNDQGAYLSCILLLMYYFLEHKDYHHEERSVNVLEKKCLNCLI